jgi:DNA-binding NarL/FixJ family response regulator
MLIERDVLVFSSDGSVRREVCAAVAQRPGARAVFADKDDTGEAERAAPIVVLDDEGRADAVELIHRLKAGGRDASIVYLAANHSVALEREVRRAGASFYAVKASRDGDLTRVIEVLLAPWDR